MEVHHWFTIGLVSAAYLVSIAAFVFGLRGKVAVLEERVQNIEEKVTELWEFEKARLRAAAEKVVKD